MPRIQEVQERALQSRGTSGAAIYEMIARALSDLEIGGETLVDVGCGSGQLWDYLRSRFRSYIGVDVVKYPDFPTEGQFVQANLEEYRVPLDSGVGDLVIAVETIEHLENPRAFFRELKRLTKPGGWLAVTTPNQLSFLSKLTLVFKNQFNAFQDNNYPAHLTALLESDLVRMAQENELHEPCVSFSKAGRIPGMKRHFPRAFTDFSPRTFSDNPLASHNGHTPPDFLSFPEEIGAFRKCER